MDTNQAVEAAMAAAAGEPPPPRRVPESYHWLLRLPPRFWSEMYHYLDYSDILQLAQLSSEFSNVRVEAYLPWTIRHAIVARRDSTCRGQRRCACYLCFQIKDFEDFQESKEMITYARVIQRDPYTGLRLFKPVPPPSPSQETLIVEPPPPRIPASPAVPGGFFATRSSGMAGLSIAMGNAGVMAGSGSVPWLRQTPSQWTPRAPGAEVGQIESLRRYCIECALKMHLLAPGDSLTTRSNASLWVCLCRVTHPTDDNQRCPTCNMSPVYRP